MVETADDHRAAIIDAPGCTILYLGAGIEIYGILSRLPDQSSDVNVRRTAVRCYAADVAGVSIGASITIRELGESFTVREKIRGQYTTELVLERSP